MPSVILIDDEPAALRGLTRQLQAHPDVQVLGTADSVTAARELLAQCETPDAVFLDIEMPQNSGFDLLQSLSPSTQILFVTAHAEHAPRAFEVAALDYLLKPVRAERLAKTLDRLRRACMERDLREGQQPEPDTSLKDHICLNVKGSTLIVPMAEIAALLAEGDFTRFILEGQPSILMGYNLGRYESMLPAPPFARISRSLLVNLERVETVTSLSRDESLLQLKGIEEPLTLRRVAAARLKALL
jgi:two-component system LytT family response regulator